MLHKVSWTKFYSFCTSSRKGLTARQAEQRLENWGANVLTGKKQTPAWIKLLGHMTNFFALLLWIGSGLAFLAEYLSPGEGNLFIGIALVVVVLINGFFTFYQEYAVEKIMQSFQALTPPKARVLRDGEIIEVLSADLVKGDVILLEEGDIVPADARLFEQNNLKVDNSAVTGESEPQLRSIRPTHDNILESRNILLSGSTVVSGTGKAIIFATGNDTQLGKVAVITSNIGESITPLQKEIQRFVRIISIIALGLGVLFFVTGLFLERSFWSNMLFAIGIIVANVPEGLLPTVTLALSMASRKMAKRNALVKRLEAVETLGSTTVICTDKTGTITQNKISVEELYLGKVYTTAQLGIKKTPWLNRILEICVLCNNARITEKQVFGDPMDKALLDFASRYINVKELRDEIPRLKEEPFDSKTRRQITVNKAVHKNAYLKGAPEVVVAQCGFQLVNGRARKLSKKEQKTILCEAENLAKKGRRVIALGYRRMDKHKSFVFCGLVAMLDPPRPEVKEALKLCHSAGIKVVMITGDHKITASSIAKQVGLIGDHACVLTGEELGKLNDAEVKLKLASPQVLIARAAPQDKLRVVALFQEMGEIVAVTGDGVNDAPALKHADIGVAMGISGSEVSKEAADMILLDDNFATIVSAVKEGRTIFANIKKFITYILTSNIPEILPFIAFVLLGIPLPITIPLILAIDLCTDLLPALGLGSEKSEKDIMNRPPRKRDERLFTWKLLGRSYGIVGMWQALAGFVTYFYILFSNGWRWGEQLAFTDPLYQQAITGFFVSIIVLQIVNVQICRVQRDSLFTKGLFSNKLVVWGILTELLIIWLITESSFVTGLFNTTSIGWALIIPVPFAIVLFLGDELRRYFCRVRNW